VFYFIFLFLSKNLKVKVPAMHYVSTVAQILSVYAYGYIEYNGYYYNNISPLYIIMICTYSRCVIPSQSTETPKYSCYYYYYYYYYYCILLSSSFVCSKPIKIGLTNALNIIYYKKMYTIIIYDRFTMYTYLRWLYGDKL
jgi:hypothetical protein